MVPLMFRILFFFLCLYFGQGESLSTDTQAKDKRHVVNINLNDGSLNLGANIIEKLKKEILAQVNNQIKNLTENVASLKKENKVYNDKVKKLEIQNVRFVSDLQNTKDAVAKLIFLVNYTKSLELQNHLLDSKIQNTNAEVTKLRTQNWLLDKDVQSLKADARNTTTGIQHLQMQNALLKDETVQMKTVVQNTKHEVQKVMKQNKILEKEVQNLKTELHHIKVQNELNCTNITESLNQLTSQSYITDTKIQQLQTEKQQIKNDFQNMETEVQTIKTEIKHMLHQNGVSVNEVQNLKNEVQHSKILSSNNTEVLNQIMSQVHSVRTEIQQIHVELQSWPNEVQSTKTMVKQHVQQIVSLEKEVQNFKNETHIIQAEINKLFNKTYTTKTEVQQMQVEKQFLDNEVHSLKDELNENKEQTLNNTEKINQEVIKLAVAVHDTKTEFYKLKALSELFGNIINKTDKEVEQLVNKTSHLDKLLPEFTSLEADLNITKTKMNSYEKKISKINDLVIQVTVSDNKLKNVTSNIKGLKNLVEDLNNQQISSYAQIQIVKNQVQNSIVNISALTDQGNKLAGQVGNLGKPSGLEDARYCVFANGDCPNGLRSYETYIKNMQLSSMFNKGRLQTKAATFGTSSVSCEMTREECSIVMTICCKEY